MHTNHDEIYLLVCTLWFYGIIYHDEATGIESHDEAKGIDLGYGEIMMKNHRT